MTSASTPAAELRLEGVIEGVLAGALSPREAATEAAFDALWREQRLSAAEPAVMAALGGALADRLAWVFLSGYQAVLRCGLPQLPVIEGWSALVNTEGVGDLPGTALTGDSGKRRLNGWKTWLAAADHVERLIVSATHNRLPVLIVGRDQPGVVIERSRSGGYLAELVQGRVRFDDVAIAEDQVQHDESMFPVFRAGEGAYVRVALHAFILAHAVRLRAPGGVIASAVAGLLGAAGAVALPLPSAAASIAVGGVDAQTRVLAGELEVLAGSADPALRERLERDARLYRSDALARRAEDALAMLGLALPRPSSA